MKRILLALVLTASSHAMQTPPAKPDAPVPSVSPSPLPPPVFEIPVDNRLFTNTPDEGGVTISPVDGKIEPFASFSVTFPTDIVRADQIDLDGVQSPFVAWPPLEGEFYWRSPATGDWTVKGPRIPGQTYRLRLREDLTALDGSALPVGSWGIEIPSDPLSASSWYDEQSRLSSRPSVPLEFNYPVRTSDLADSLWFQDRASRKRFPAQISVSSDSGVSPTNIRATPREPLPVGAFYDLVVESVRDAYAGRTLPYPRVFPLGTTRPLAVVYVAARNWATDKPHVEIKFTNHLSDDALPKNAVTIDPPVANLALRNEGDTLHVGGDFDTSIRYKATISQKITGDRGFPMAADSVWGATFSNKPPTILFPPGEFRQRGALGLRFALIQSNAGPLQWRLAQVPDNQLPAVLNALGNEPRAGDPLLVDAMNLPVAARGEFPEVIDNREELRKIEWKGDLAGPHLIEAVAPAADGNRVANRALIWFGDLALTQKLSPDSLTIRVASMASGQPEPGVRVQLLTRELLEISALESDSSGLVTFPRTASSAATFFRITLAGKSSLWPVSTDGQFSSGSASFSPKPSLLGQILTDRPIYRPGQELKIKGFIRERKNNRLSVPAGQTISWQITKSWQDDIVASGKAKVSPAGGWDAAWTVPEDGDLGDFRVRAKLGLAEAGTQADFQIEEFRNPPFSVSCSVGEATNPAESVLNISSRYFHGAPNVGSRAKWKAVWLTDFGDYDYDEEEETPSFFTNYDASSENAKEPVADATSEGEATLNSSGQTTIISKQPFPDSSNRAKATVVWQVDVTGPDGQTITGGAVDNVTMNDVTLAIRPIDQRPDATLRFELRTVPRIKDAPVPGQAPVTLFLVKTKSVKEQIAPFVYRYRNVDEFSQVTKKSVPSNGFIDFPAPEPGRYVLVAGPLPGSIAVSTEQDSMGPGEAEFPIRSDETLELRGPSEPVIAGQTASFDVLSPSGGVAWVTVETDRILDSRTVDLPGTATRVDIPTREDFAPNAFATVYVLRPGATDRIAAERFGFCQFKVTDPSKTLALAPQISKPEFEPRESVTGSVTVSNAGTPVAGAEVTLYAVDDSILTLGNWSLPDLVSPFYPYQPYSIITSPALRGIVAGFAPDQLTQKGYTVGDGGDDQFGNVEFTRKNFKPLLFWNPSLKTDASGSVTFTTTAPDNLGRFRVIALAQTTTSQFGSASETFEVTKKLLIEPSLPRFLREGDQVNLRAVARQKMSDSESLAIRCVTSLELTAPDRLDLSAARNAPAVAQFAARVGSDLTSATVRFDVASTNAQKATDSVEITLPVLPRSITVSESKAGNWSGDRFAVSNFMPPLWQSSLGTVTTTLSTSSWLTKLMGLPAVLDYPHGCLEQQSSRILAFTAFANLLKWIPTNPARDANYERTIWQSLQVLEDSLLPDGLLPYWPMGTDGNAFVTIQTAFATAMAEADGFEVPERLATELPETIASMAYRRLKVPPTLRAFAIFVLAQTAPSQELSATADDLYLERDKLTYEGKALLALAYAAFQSSPDKLATLIGELPTNFPAAPFDPQTFSSPTRAEALCLLARLTANPANGASAIRTRLNELIATSSALSTQENLWLLFAFKTALTTQPAAALPKTLRPTPGATSPNKSSASWPDQPIDKAATLAISGLGSANKGTFVLATKRQLGPTEVQPVQNGIRLDRLTKNLTDATRTGTPDAPFRLGDEILITYRFDPAKPQSFLALEDALPAAIEVLNPNLDLFGKAFAVATDPNVPTASLSHSQLRDSSANLYFDDVPAGLHTYSILARITSAGTFTWPAAQIYPMYDSHTFARTAPSLCIVTPE